MGLIEINRDPSPKVLRQFGWIALSASLLVCALLRWQRHLALPWLLAIFGAGLAVFVCSRLSLRLTRRVFVTLVLLSYPIGVVLGTAAMAIIFFLVLTPIGLVFRLLGRDPLYRRWDKSAASYWVTHGPADRPDRYFRQF